MKIRNGFVSNSSSSSYLISFNLNINIYDILNNNSNSCDATRVDSFELKKVINELKKWFNIGTEYQDDSDTKYFLSVASKASRGSEGKNNIALISVSHYDNNMLEILNNCKDIKIIEDFG